MRNHPLFLAMLMLTGMSPEVSAADAKGSADHPLVKRVTGSEIIWSKVSKFDEMTVALEKIQYDYGNSAFKATKKEKVEDSLTKNGRISICGVYFDTDESAGSLVEMANAIKAAGGEKFLIVGHTDNQCEFGHNQTLSQMRAAAVTNALTNKYGVPSGNVIPVGVGMAAPVASNTDEPGRAKNRRVEIVAM